MGRARFIGGSRVKAVSWLVALWLMTLSLPVEGGPGRDPCSAKGPGWEDRAEAAQCWLDTGRWEKFERDVKKLARFRDKNASHRARFLRAQRELLRGRFRIALREIQWVAKRHPVWFDVHVKWAELLLSSGQNLRARPILDRLPELYEAGKIQSNRDKLELARALALLGYARDAHEVFRDLVRADADDWKAHLHWARLLKSKHNPEEAHKEYEEVLRIWPDRPEATVGLAELLFERANQVHGARKLLHRLKMIYGPLRSVRLLEARMALYQESFTSAETLARVLVGENPRDREAWTILGALAFLRGDQKGLNTIAARVEEIHPKNAAFWHELGLVASRFHRYERAVEFHRHALGLDPEYTVALVDLGIAHSRLGDDARARVFLNKAREADRFDQRAFNMTARLFDGALKNYLRWEHEGILYRLSRREAPALKATLPAWLREGRERYRRRYGVRLKTPMNVEIFEDPQTFSIRAVGTTHFWAHGVCFGRVLAMRSPNAGDFNAREVLLHELSHAYHLQMTGGRVPRWFTEGLAELDTMGVDPSLVREIYGPMSERLVAKEMVPICTLNRAFDQVSSKDALLAAYMQSRLVLEWLEAEQGGPGIRAMLKEFGAGSGVDTALRRVYGLSCAGADKRFTSWARGRLVDYLAPKVHLPQRLPPAKVLAKRIKAGDVRAGALLAWLKAMAGELEKAEVDLEDPRIGGHPIGRWLSAWLAWKNKDNELALTKIEEMERAGHSGLPVALLKAQILDENGRPERATEILERCVKKGPRSPALFQKLKKLYEDNPIPGRMVDLLEAWSLWDEHNPVLRRELARRRMKAKKISLAKQAVGRWMEVEPLAGQAWLDLANLEFGAKQDCALYLEQLVIARGRAASVDVDSLLNEVDCTWKQGQVEDARRLLREFRVLNPDHPRAEELRSRIR